MIKKNYFSHIFLKPNNISYHLFIFYFSILILFLFFKTKRTLNIWYLGEIVGVALVPAATLPSFFCWHNCSTCSSLVSFSVTSIFCLYESSSAAHEKNKVNFYGFHDSCLQVFNSWSNNRLRISHNWLILFFYT